MLTVRGGPVDGPRGGLARVCQCVQYPLRAFLIQKTFVPPTFVLIETQYRVGPAACRGRKPLSPPGCRPVRISQIADPAAAHGARRNGARVRRLAAECLSGQYGARSQGRCDDRPRAIPRTDQGGRSRTLRVARGGGQRSQHGRRVAEIAELLDVHRSSFADPSPGSRGCTAVRSPGAGYSAGTSTLAGW
ncbi:Uncharacterised protein [Mycobacteroides abscessus]|nr:Uncharacterised protein [Mycobacteroides abscessus]